MREIQAVLEEIVKDVPRLAVEKMLTRKLKKAGFVEPGADGIKSAALALMRGEEDINIAGGKGSIEITAQDVKEVEDTVDAFLNGGMETMVETSSDAIADILYNSLFKKLPAEVAAQRDDIAAFKDRLERRYGVGLNKLRMMLIMAREWVQDLQARKTEEQGGKVSTLDDVLFRLHVRGCQIVTEIIVLLENGLADGAIARWRTLHEVATVAAFIRAHGQDVAVKYRDYQIVESKRAADMFKTNHAAFGYKPMSKKQAARTNAAFKRMLKKHGPLFGEDYGWAGSYFKGGRANFAKIEDAVGLPEMRSMYKLASYNVHASTKGAYYRIGALNGSGAIIAGHSNAGLTEPAQNCAVSFAKLCALLPGEPSDQIIDDLVILKLFERLMFEVPRDIWKAEKKLKSDDRRYRKTKDKAS